MSEEMGIVAKYVDMFLLDSAGPEWTIPTRVSSEWGQRNRTEGCNGVIEAPPVLNVQCVCVCVTHVTKQVELGSYHLSHHLDIFYLTVWTHLNWAGLSLHPSKRKDQNICWRTFIWGQWPLYFIAFAVLFSPCTNLMKCSGNISGTFWSRNKFMAVPVYFIAAVEDVTRLNCDWKGQKLGEVLSSKRKK